MRALVKIAVSVVFIMFTAVSAMAGCDQASSLNGWNIQPDEQVILIGGKIYPCPDVPNATYGGGGVKVKTVQATACFQEEFLVPGKGIVRRNKTYEYTVALVYNPNKGSHEVVRTERNQPCWTQNVVPGTWMAVHVTCEFYTGWVAVKVIKPGRYQMVRVPWTFAEKIG